MYCLVKNPVLAAALISSSSSANDRGSLESRRRPSVAHRLPALPAATARARPLPTATTESLISELLVNAFPLSPTARRGKPTGTAAPTWGSSAHPSLPSSVACYSHASLSRCPSSAFISASSTAPAYSSVIARAQKPFLSSDASPQGHIHLPVQKLPSPSSSLAGGNATWPVSHLSSSCYIDTPGEVPTYLHLLSSMPLSPLENAAYTHFHIQRNTCPLPYTAFVSPVAGAPTSVVNAISPSLPSNIFRMAGCSAPAGERRGSPVKALSQIHSAGEVAAAPGKAATGYSIATERTSTSEATAARHITVRSAPAEGETARVRRIGGVATEIGATAAIGRHVAGAAPALLAAKDHKDTALKREASETTFAFSPGLHTPTEGGQQVTRLEPEEEAPVKNEAATDEFGPPATIAGIANAVADERVIIKTPQRLSGARTEAERDVLSDGADAALAAAAAARCTNPVDATAAWIANGRFRVSPAGGCPTADADAASGVDASLTSSVKHKGRAKKACLRASEMTEIGSKTDKTNEEAASPGGDGSPVEGITEIEQNVSFMLRGGGGGEWTDGGGEREEDVVFTGNSDAVFFPAFPVHRCRGVSLWDIETNERVCLGKFEETAGLLLLTPDTLMKLALSFHTPFFDGVVLRSFVAPRGNANGMNAHDREPHHRHRSRPSEHPLARSARARSDSATHAGAGGSRSSSAARVPSTGATAVGDAVEHEPAAKPQHRVAAASPSSPRGTAPAQAVDAVTDASARADFVSPTEGDSETARTPRRTLSDNKQRPSTRRAGTKENAPATAEEPGDAISALPLTDQTQHAGVSHKISRRGNRESSSSAAETATEGNKEDSAGADGMYEGRQERHSTAPEVAGGDVTSLADIRSLEGQPSGGRHRNSASPSAAGGGSRGAADVKAAQTDSTTTTGRVDELASTEPPTKHRREGLNHRYKTVKEREAESPDIAGGRHSSRSSGGETGRYTRRGKEQQPVSNASGRAPVTGVRSAGTEAVRVLEGVLIDPEELLEAMAAKHKQQQPHASVDGQWMRVERPRPNTEYKLCIGESYWMAMKIPLEACNPFLLNRNDVVVDLIEPKQEQQQFPGHATEGAPITQRRPPPSSEMVAGAATGADGHQHHSETRGKTKFPAPSRSRVGPAAGAGGETNHSPRGDSIPPAVHAGNEDEAEVARPRTFTGWLGNRVSDRMNRIAADAPAGLTNAVNRLVDTLPTTPEEAEELGKKWSEQSVRAGRAISASAKLLMKSFRHAAAELWFLITEGKSGSSSTGG